MLLTMFAAIELILVFIPGAGHIDMGSWLPAITLHIPVVMAGAMLGPGAGALLGLIMGCGRLAALGLVSPIPLVSYVFTPFMTPQADRLWLEPSLWSLVICLVPPVVMGIISGVLLRGFGRVLRFNAVSLAISGAIGTLVGQVITYAGIILVFRQGITALTGSGAWELFTSAVSANIGPEAGAAALLCIFPGAIFYSKFVLED